VEREKLQGSLTNRNGFSHAAGAPLRHSNPAPWKRDFLFDVLLVRTEAANSSVL
jgi:hypothetical protein